jgi:hypothetical protein
VWTERVDHADSARGITKRDQAFAKQAQSDGLTVWFGELLGKRQRQPEPSEQLTHRLAATDAGHKRITFGAQHGVDLLGLTSV